MVEKNRDAVASILNWILYVTARSNSLARFGFTVRKQCLVALNLQAETGAVGQVAQVHSDRWRPYVCRVSALVAESWFGETYA